VVQGAEGSCSTVKVHDIIHGDSMLACITVEYVKQTAGSDRQSQSYADDAVGHANHAQLQSQNHQVNNRQSMKINVAKLVCARLTCSSTVHHPVSTCHALSSVFQPPTRAATSTVIAPVNTQNRPALEHDAWCRARRIPSTCPFDQPDPSNTRYLYQTPAAAGSLARADHCCRKECTLLSFPCRLITPPPWVCRCS
jgi:hypothetical protein